MPDAPVHKADLDKGSRLKRLIRSNLDPRSWAHVFKLVNYYGYTHVNELRQARLDQDVRVAPNVSIANGRNIEIGARARIGANVSLWGGPGAGRIVIGPDALIAPNVMVTAANYRFNDGSPINDQAMDEADVTIGRDVWLGYGAVVLPGTQIGDGCVISAGAVVRGHIAPNSVVAGNPAQVVGQRLTRDAGPQAIDTSGAQDARVLDIIHREIPTLDMARIDGPIDDSGIDSFDLITLRTAIEKDTGRMIPDREWGAIGSLSDIPRLPVFATGAAPSRPLSAPTAVDAAAGPAAPAPQTGILAPGQARRDYVINMPQMALSGLSESWLFKEIGDIHWDMITDFLQSPSSGISDDLGDRLYATFTRIRLDVDPTLQTFNENDDLSIASTLERFGAGFYFADHTISSANANGTARTMSTFAKYGERGKNTSLMKGTPTLPQPDAINALDAFPEFGVEYRARRAQDMDPASFECEYEILPCHDINGVGLLYFAAYPTIFDLCLEQAEGKGFLIGHSTVSKDICYYANSEPDETLVFRLHAREEDGDLIRHVVSLSRKSDNKRMSEAISVKRRIRD